RLAQSFRGRELQRRVEGDVSLPARRFDQGGRDRGRLRRCGLERLGEDGGRNGSRCLEHVASRVGPHGITSDRPWGETQRSPTARWNSRSREPDFAFRIGNLSHVVHRPFISTGGALAGCGTWSIAKRLFLMEEVAWRNIMTKTLATLAAAAT